MHAHQAMPHGGLQLPIAVNTDTVSAVVARFINGMKAQGTPLKDARVVFYGAGSSAVGVATMIAQLLVKEEGLTFDQAKQVPILSGPCMPVAWVASPHVWCMRL